MSKSVEIVDAGTGPELDLIETGSGRAWAVIWPGMGARLRSMHRISLQPGGATQMLCHQSEAVYYVISGSGSILDAEVDADFAIEEGTMIHVGPGSEYRFGAQLVKLELIGGPCPPDPSLYRGFFDVASFVPGDIGPAKGSAAEGVDDGVHLFHCDRPERRLPMIASDARLVVWPAVGAETANMNFVDMKPGEENVPHAHSYSEDTIFILEGKGSISDLTNERELKFEAGNVIHVPVGVEHQVRADRNESIVSVGGPCPADIPMLRIAGALD